MRATALIILSLLLLAPMESYAKCRFDSGTSFLRPFGNNNDIGFIQTRADRVGSSWTQAITFQLSVEEGTYYLKVKTSTSFTDQQSYTSDLPLDIELQTGETISLVLPDPTETGEPRTISSATVATSGSTSVSVGVSSSSADLVFPVAREVIEKLAAIAATTITLRFLAEETSDLREFEVKPKWAENLAESATCLLTEYDRLLEQG